MQVSQDKQLESLLLAACELGKELLKQHQYAHVVHVVNYKLLRGRV